MIFLRGVVLWKKSSFSGVILLLPSTQVYIYYFLRNISDYSVLLRKFIEYSTSSFLLPARSLVPWMTNALSLNLLVIGSKRMLSNISSLYDKAITKHESYITKRWA